MINGVEWHTERRVLAGLLLLAALALPIGCSRSDNAGELPTEYGAQVDTSRDRSVNGYSALAEMFAAAGHRVRARETLSPALAEGADVIVWPPDSFNVPTAATCDWFETWLRGKPNRTLIYIGRDFDAAPVYWRKLLAEGTEANRNWIESKLALANASFQSLRAEMPDHQTCRWFSLHKHHSLHPRVVTEFLGRPGWADVANPAHCEIELWSRMVPQRATDLLAADVGEQSPEMIVARRDFDVLPDDFTSGRNESAGSSSLLLVANGSFLVNLALVNHEHRKLAERLVDSVGQSQRVVFLASSGADPPIRTSSSSERPHGMLDVFDKWPISMMFIQWGIVIVVLCFARWPIFGPPRDPPPPPASDFGRHVTALGESLELTRDGQYARARWEQYRQIKRDSRPA